tara:strand:- start:669 stop:1916 length:1248 start_codon:yes stop_codon:yes gene_type:complete
MRGHEEASGTKYVPEELLQEWAEKDPISNYESFLIREGLLDKGQIEELRTKIEDEISEHLKIAFDEPSVEFNLTQELTDVYHPHNFEEIKPKGTTSNIRFVDAVSEGLQQSMERNDDLVIMGQDVAEYGGVFKVTEGFVELFGKNRVRNTPICESGIVEAAMGLSINGMKAVMEMQFADFATSGFNPIVNYLAKSHYRWGEPAQVVIRMPCGGDVGAGPFHSQTNEAWFTKTPGLKVVYPAFPYDAKGLLATAIEDPNPIMFFEHKALYRSIYQEVPNEYYNIPFGQAALLKEGSDVTIVTYGAAVHWALAVLNERKDISADLLDLRTLCPLDIESIYVSVEKTGKLIILQEDSLFGGIASDISAMVTENRFEYLDAPIKRVASLETPIPFAKPLENGYLPKTRFAEVLNELLAY